METQDILAGTTSDSSVTNQFLMSDFLSILVTNPELTTGPTKDHTPKIHCAITPVKS